AEDGIRDFHVTGVQTCALPIFSAFTEAGGEISEQIWHPLGTQDFSSYITQIQAGSPDVVFIGSAGGADAIQLWSSWTDFGLEVRSEERRVGKECGAGGSRTQYR